MVNAPSASAGPFRRRRYPLANAGRYSVRWRVPLRRCDSTTLQDSSHISVSKDSESDSKSGSVGVGALAAPVEPPGGVGALASWSGESIEPLGTGVAAGEEEA